MEQPVRDEFSDDESSCEEDGEPSPDDSDVLDMIEVPQHDEKEYPKRPKKRKKPKKRKPLKIPKKAKPRKAKPKPKLKLVRIPKKRKSRKTSLRNIPPAPPPIPAEPSATISPRGRKRGPGPSNIQSKRAKPSDKDKEWLPTLH